MPSSTSEEESSVFAAIARAVKTDDSLVTARRLFDEWNFRPVTSDAAIPVPLILHCPECGACHIDPPDMPAHKTHACQKCGEQWCVSVCNTVGVQFLPSCKNGLTFNEWLDKTGRSIVIRNDPPTRNRAIEAWNEGVVPFFGWPQQQSPKKPEGFVHYARSGEARCPSRRREADVQCVGVEHHAGDHFAEIARGAFRWPDLRVNRNALTFTRWLNAAGYQREAFDGYERDRQNVLLDAWNRGEDPSDHLLEASLQRGVERAAKTIRDRMSEPDYNPASFELEIRSILEPLGKLLVEKNAAYGDSALNPLRIFSRASTTEQIFVRIDDKLSRLKRGSAAGEDVIHDLLGYLVLLRIQQKREENAAK